MLRASVRRLITLLPALLTLSWPAVGYATWSTDPSINNAVSLDQCHYVGPEDHAACTDGAGGMFVTWNNEDIGVAFAQHILADGTIAPGWAANGLALITPGVGLRGEFNIIPDGVGGALVAWVDSRNGNYGIFAQRISSGGTLLWGNSLEVSLTANDDTTPVIATDGAHGMFIAWRYAYSPTDHDIYGMHVLSSGVMDGAWVSGGQAIAVTGYEEQNPAILSDAQGGFWVAWDVFDGSTFDVVMSHLNSAGQPVPGSIPSGTNVTSGVAGDQYIPLLATDGAGGALMVWYDFRNGNSDIYMTHAAAGATTAPPSGFVVVADASAQYPRLMCPDGQGGMFALWDDSRFSTPYPFVNHMRQDGSRYPGWPVDGLPAAGMYTLQSVAVPDGTGGLFVSFESTETGVRDIVATHLLSDGTLAPGWVDGGNPVCTSAGHQYYPTLVPDGTGGALITWWDARSNSAFDHYAQRIDGFGVLGDASPAITSAQDVQGDQGGAVRLEWNASYLDAQPTAGIGSYWIWRQVPAAAPQAAGSRAVWLASGDDPMELARAGRRVFAHARGARTAASGYAWEYLASQPAHSGAAYSYVAPTAADSSGVSFAYTLFMVEAHASASTAFWPSAPDSGYSVDNLAPAMPAPFAGSYAAGATTMTWGENGEPDFAHYRLYRGSAVDFTPGPGNLVAAPTSAGFSDPAGAPYVYKLSAVDVHGNESPVATLVPSGTTDIAGALPTTLAFAIAGDNPSRSGAELRFALPHAGAVRIAIFDALGRRVRMLADATYPAGRFTVRWDGANEAGSGAGNGIYFARLEALGRTLNRKLVIRR